MKSKVRDVGFLKQLFVDDYIIEETRNLCRTLNRAKKHPANPVLTAELPWEEPTRIVVLDVLYDEKKKNFRMWYSTNAGVCYATSNDGLKWERPNLGLVEYKGSKENNIVSGLKGGCGIVYSPECEGVEVGERLYKTLCLDGKGWGAYFSPDGFTWTPYPNNPVLTAPNIGDVCRVGKSSGYLPKGFFYKDVIPPKYIAFPKLGVKTGKYSKRSVGFAGCEMTFPDIFTKWSPPTLVLAPDELDDEMAEERIAAAKDIIEFNCPEDHRAEFYGMHGFAYDGMYLGLLQVFDATMELRRVGRLNQDGVNEIQLTSSRNLIHWQRAGDRKPILVRGKAEEWDCGWIAPSNPIIVGDEVWIYYNGRNWSHHGAELPWSKPRIQGVGLATLRLDGFVSLDAGEEEGTLTTKPMVFEGNELVVNAQAEKGSVTIEVLDENGKPIKGFKRGDCDTFTGDSVRHMVTWKGSSDIASMQGKAVKLRFHMKKAKLYSFSFQI